jgi:putative acetyltransferase
MPDRVTALKIEIDDPSTDDVRALIAVHLGFAHDVTPAGHVHALPVDELLPPDVTLFSARRNQVLMGMGALQHLDDSHAEIKSMHTTTAARRTGVARALLDRLMQVARERGYETVSLETGTGEAFAAAHSLYAAAGFRACAPFAEYAANPYSICMTFDLRTYDEAER